MHGIKHRFGFALHINSETFIFIINLYNQNEKVSLEDLSRDEKCMWNALGIDLHAMYLLT